MFKNGPDPVEIQDLQFKLKTRLKVFESSEGFATSQLCSLVACASRFGLLFVGTNTANIQAIQLKDIGNNQNDTSNYPRRDVAVASPPTHLSLNCDHTILAVVAEKSGCSWVVFYDVKSFWRRDISVISEVRLSATPGVQIVEAKWNPTIMQCFTACKSDGSLGIYEIKNSGVDINELPSASGAACFSWSPKGKQIAVGSRDGQITQYRPDLKAVKVIRAPPSKESYKLLALQWVSTYQFIGVYQSHNPAEQPSLLVVDAPKTGDLTFLNYYDICYSNGNTRPPQFYLMLQSTWNILMVASSNSMEVGVLGNDNTSWIQWTMGDAARAELPLHLNRQETLPIGCDFDISSISPILWGESTLPPAPILLLLSHYGVLCCFNIVYLKEGIPSICTPSEPISDTSGIQYFTDKSTAADTAISTITGPVANTGKSLDLLKSQISKDVPQSPISASIAQPTVSITPKNPIELFSGQSILTAISADSKLSTNQLPSKYQGLYPSLVDNSENLLSSIKASAANMSNAPSSTKQVLTGLSTVPSQPPAIIQEPEIRKDLTTVSNDTLTDEETEKLLGQMVHDECVFLESELKAVLYQGKLLKINLGTDDDKTAIVGSTALLEEFFKEMTDICSSQNTEVHILKQNLLQSWAWYEEIKSRQVTSKNESMQVLLKAQPLDPASEKRLDDIQHAKYYLESQITQAHRALDEQWEIFQDYCKKTNRIQIPTMEMIFQTMVKQTAILQKKKYILKDIASRLKCKSRPSVGPSLLSSINDAQELIEELERLRMNPEDIHEIHFDRIRNRIKNFTKKHGDDLRSFLKKREIPHIAVVKPQLSTSILQSPSSKLKYLSTTSKTLLNNTTPSVEKVAKKIDFVASTPKTMISSTAPASEGLPLQNLQSLTLRLETPHFNKMSSLSSKGVVAGSPNSAFASTAVTTTSAPTLISFKPVAFSATSSQSNKQLPTYAIATATSTSSQPVITLGKPFSFGKTPATAAIPTVTSTSGIITTTKSNFTFSFQGNEFLTSQDSTIGANLAPKATTPFSVLNLTVSSKPLTSVAQTIGYTASSTVPSANTSIFGGSNLKLNKQQIPNVTSTIKTPPLFAVSPSKPIFPPAVTTSAAPNEISSLKPLQSKFSITPQTSAFGSNANSMFGNAAVTTASLFTPSTTKPIVLTPLATTNPEISSSSIPMFNVQSTTNAPANVSNVTNFASTAVGATQSPVFKSPITSTDIATSNLPFGSSITITKSPLNVNDTSVAPTTPVAKPLTISTKSSTKILATTAPDQPVISITPITSGFNPASTSISKTLTPAVATVVSTTSVQHTSLASTAADVNTSTLSLSVTSLATSIFSTPSADTSSGVVLPASATSKPFESSGTSTGSPFITATACSPLFTSSTVSASQFFGSASTTSTSVFGNITTTKSSIFGNVTTEPSSFADSTSSTVFGNSAPSIFASAHTTATSAFGNVSSSTPVVFNNVMTTQVSSFGTFSTKPSIFGTSSSAPISTQSGIFGNSNQSSVFGNTSTTTTQSIFEPPKTTQSIFGQSTFGAANASPFGGNSVFGGSATFGQSSGSLFGNTTTTTTTAANIFGNTPTTNSAFGSNSVFGTATTSAPFGSSGPFSSSSQQAFSNTSGGAFGFGSLNVGPTSAASSSVFGSTSANPFAASDNKSIFGVPSSSSSSVFGGSAGNSSTTAFGNSQSQGFGSGGFTSGQPIFGQQASATFGSSTFGQPAPGPFSGGGGSIAQSGFGASSTFQKPTNFGASTGFGGAASFGSSPSFGGAPTFGSAASFGSPSKMFGSPTAGFPQSQQSTGFGNLADQATVGFGNLAQQTTNQNANTPFSGNSSFSSWR